MVILSAGTVTHRRGTADAIDTYGLILMRSTDSLAFLPAGAYYMGNENEAAPRPGAGDPLAG